MSTIRVRRLDASHDPVFGNGKADYLTDINAVAQIIQTRLLLFWGEWWENQKAGISMFQSILGKSGARNKEAADTLLKNYVLETPYVTGIKSFASTFNGVERKYNVSMEVNTKFGVILVSSTPPSTILGYGDSYGDVGYGN